MFDGFRVNITDRALADLEVIFDFIHGQSLLNAKIVLRRLLDAADDLAYMPLRFHQSGRSRKYGHPIHSRVVRPFIVYFRIDAESRTVYHADRTWRKTPTPSF